MERDKVIAPVPAFYAPSIVRAQDAKSTDARLQATLDNIQRMIGEGNRFSASIQSTDQVGDRVNSRIQIEPRTP